MLLIATARTPGNFPVAKPTVPRSDSSPLQLDISGFDSVDEPRKGTLQAVSCGINNRNAAAGRNSLPAMKALSCPKSPFERALQIVTPYGISIMRTGRVERSVRSFERHSANSLA
jgi:hypothetical protein